MAIIATSDIDGTELGTFRSLKAAWAAVHAYDTAGRKAAFTKRLTGADKAAGAKAALTKRLTGADKAAGAKAALTRALNAEADMQEEYQDMMAIAANRDGKYTKAQVLDAKAFVKGWRSVKA
jgi:hypothetical protein